MSETTTQMRYGGLSPVELGVLIGGVGLAILILIVIITLCCIRRPSTKKASPKKIDNGNVVSMQTARNVNGQPMQQIILKTQPSSDDMTKTSEHEHSNTYRTMDTETNTVRYDTAHQQARQEQQAAPQAVPVTAQAAVIKIDQSEADVDSGTGDSPIRTSVVVHSEHEENGSVHNGSSYSNGNGSASNEPEELADEDKPMPYATTRPDYDMPPPPPPQTDPPPMTPGIPVTDLDEGETIIVPPPPPLPKDPIYAEINKSRDSHGASIKRDDSTKRSFFRDAAEIQIIEKEKF